jgi:hypothetical protein
MKQSFLRSLLAKWGIRLFFVGVLGVGLVLVDDYGLSWDEPRSRLNGYVTANYLLRGDPTLFTYEDRQYGPVFEVVLFSVEKIVGLTDSRAIYLVRHGLTFLVFWAGVVAFYHLARIFLKSRLWGWVAATFLLFSPPIFAHAFYNSKDIPLLVLFIVSGLTFAYYLQKPQVKRLLFHSLSCALLVDIRIVGIVAPLLTGGVILAQVIGSKKRQNVLHLGILAGSFGGLTVLFWPWLWSNPLGHFWQAFALMRAFPWERTVLYWGTNYLARELPWHYLPVWIALSTPLLYLGGFSLGLSPVIREVVRGPQKAGLTWWVLGWLLVPLIAIMVVRPVLYDSWRQAFFLYPALVLIACAGLQWLKQKASSCWLVAGLLIVGILEPLGFMVKNHPHEYVFFNLLAKPLAASHQFELDYWGLSYRQGLEYILATDARDKIRVLVLDEPGRTNAYLLPKSARNRLIFTDSPDTADYGMTAHRWQTGNPPAGVKVYSLMVNAAEIMTVYRLEQ